MIVLPKVAPDVFEAARAAHLRALRARHLLWGLGRRLYGVDTGTLEKFSDCLSVTLAAAAVGIPAPLSLLDFLQVASKPEARALAVEWRNPGQPALLQALAPLCALAATPNSRIVAVNTYQRLTPEFGYEPCWEVSWEPEPEPTPGIPYVLQA